MKRNTNGLINNAKAKIRRVKKTHNIDLSDEIQLPSLSSFKTVKSLITSKRTLTNSIKV
jgi:hypothetical protein